MASQGEEEHRGGVGASPGHGLPTHSTHTDHPGRRLGARRQGKEGQERSNPDTPHRYRPPSVEMSGWAGPYGGAARVYTQLGGVLRARQMGQQDARDAHKEQLFSPESRRPLITDKLEALQGSRGKREDNVSSSVNGTRQSRSARCEQQALPPEGPVEHTMSHTLQSSHMGVRRTKSLDHRLMESSSTPDLLNFKKGWLSKLFDGGAWKKRWFVLTDRSLRWYRDAVAEETADLDGEVDLSTCCDVTEFPVLRNYGFQIHTKDGTVTLSAVTSGIRRHWIQAMLKNVKTITAPDVTRKHTSLKLPGSKCSTFPEKARAKAGRAVALPCPTMSGLNAHGAEAELQTQMDNRNGTEQRRSRICDRRLEGRYKTFDWAEFRRELLPQKSSRPPEKAAGTSATTMPKEEGANRAGCGLEKDPPREEGLSSTARLQQETSLPCQQEELKPPEDERQATNSANTPASVTPDLCAPLQVVLEKQRRALDSDVLQKDSPSSPWMAVSSGPQHGAEEQGQPRLSEASSEWALARVRTELQLEQERSRECRQQRECAEQGLRAQLQESEERLRAVEAHLLQRSQALRDLERQQALQRDHLNEAPWLQERLAEVTGRLVTTEEAQAIRKQRLQGNLEVLQGQQERERHGLAQCLATAQGNMWQLEQRLQEVEQQAEALLRDKRPTGLAAGEAQLLLKEDAIEKLTETVRLLEAEKSQLHRHCRELAQQAATADSKWKQLREMGSCAEKSQRFQQVLWALRQKDEEIQKIKETYEKMLQRKDQDLNEAVVKMAALGSSLEETELRLQAKEQLLRQLSCGGEASKLQVELMRAVEQIVQLEQCQEGLRLAHADLQKAHAQLQQDYNALNLHLKSFSMAETLAVWRDASCVEEMPEDQGSVRCGAPMGPGHFVSQESCKASAQNDPAGFISVIRFLEAKLLATEEKLRDITVKLKDQQDSGTGWHSWGCGSRIETCAELGKLDNKHHQDTGKWTSSTRAVDPRSRRTQTWVEPSRKEASAAPNHDGLLSDMEHPLLAEVGRELSSIAHNIGLGGGFWESDWTDCEDTRSTEVRDRNVLQEDGTKRIAKMLAFEALVLSRIASSIRSQNVDLFLNLSEIHQEAEKLKSNDDGNGEVDVHAMALKLRVESEFWIEVEKLKMCQDGAESTEGSFIENPCVKAKLAYAVQNLKLLYKVNFQRLQEDTVNIQKSSQSRDLTLRGKEEAAKSPAADLMPEDVQKEPACDPEHPRMDCPGDLASYSITMESLRLSQDTLASELEAQAAFLQRLSREVGTSLKWKSSGLHLWLEAVYRTNSCYSKGSDTWGHTRCLQEAMVQAQVAYVVCRLRAEHKNSLQLCGDAASLQAENEHLHKKLLQLQQHLSQLEQTEARQQVEALQVEQRRAATELALIEEAAENKRKLELVLIEVEKMEDRHEEHVQKLEETFQRRVRELGSSHESESGQLSGLDTPPHCRAPPQHPSVQPTDLVALRKRIQELAAQVKVMKKELGNKQLEKSISGLKEEYQQDLEHLKVTCQRGFAAMEDAHQRTMEELHKRHQMETAKLQEERDRLLAEETAATIAAIEAMKKAHREELEKVQRAQLSRRSDASEPGCHYEEELKSVHRELDVLSEQYSHKCLESTHLAQALETRRLALRRCQLENRELNAHNQELNRQLKEEMSRMRSGPPGIGAGPSGTQSSEQYEMEVLLRVKEAELQCLKQELRSLQDELQALLRVQHAAHAVRSRNAKCSAGDKHNGQPSVTKAREERLAAAMEARGVKCESSPRSQKKERPPSAQPRRGVRSKSLKEGLTPQECVRLFEDADSRKI